MVEEIRQRELCDFCLYVLTPRMTGVYSIAEVVDDSNKRPHKTVFCILATDGALSLSPSQLKSLGQVSQMVEANGGIVYATLVAVADYLNRA